MSAPNLSITVEPREGGKVLYLPLAPMSANAKARAKVVVRLQLRNNSTSTLTLEGIAFAFPGSGLPAVTMQEVKIAAKTPTGDPLDAGKIPASTTVLWSNGSVDQGPGNDDIHNQVYLDQPAPATLKIDVHCTEFNEPATTTVDLAPYTDPTGRGAFLLPFSPADLEPGEYVVTSARHGFNEGANGNQIYAHDITIQARVNGKWTDVRSGADEGTNESRRIYGRPVRAMADGTIESFKSDTPENPKPGVKPKPAPQGNHFWIRHGNVTVKYTHLKHGSMVAELMKEGAVVHAGQVIGLAGNSGNADGPHLHIHGSHVGDNTLRGLPFRHGWVLDREQATADGSGPWVPLKAEGIGFDATAIWPSSTRPRVIVAATGIARSGDWGNSFWTSDDLADFTARAQKLFDEKGRRLTQVASYLERGQRRFVGIARDGDWANHFWVSTDLPSFKSEVQRLFDEKSRRLVHVHTWPEGSGHRFAGIARGGEWGTRFWVSNDLASFRAEAQKLFDDKGYRLTHASTYREGQTRRWLGIARSGDWSNSFWVSDDRASFVSEAQRLFDDKGRRLVHVHTYVEGGKRRWAGIARSGDWANTHWFSPHIDAFRLEAQRLFDEHQRRLICVEILDDEA